MQFNKRLKSIRQRSKFTQKSIAEYLGVTVRTYQRYEEGTIEPTISTVSSMAAFFDVPVDCLLGIGIFEHWDEIIINKSIIVEALKNWNLPVLQALDFSDLTEGQLARLLSAMFKKIIITDNQVDLYPLLPFVPPAP